MVNESPQRVINNVGGQIYYFRYFFTFHFKVPSLTTYHIFFLSSDIGCRMLKAGQIFPFFWVLNFDYDLSSKTVAYIVHGNIIISVRQEGYLFQTFLIPVPLLSNKFEIVYSFCRSPFYIYPKLLIISKDQKTIQKYACGHAIFHERLILKSILYRRCITYTYRVF